MALSFYTDYPFIPQNKMILVDTFTGDGTTKSFTLRNKTSPYLAGAIQADSTIFQRYLNGFSVSSNTFTLTSAPALNSQIVAPGTVGLNFDVFDTASEPSVSGPANVKEVAFYLADDGLTSQNIFANTYTAVNGNPGIAVLFRNLATAAGASTTWTQLSSADASGNVVSYQATGATLYLPNFYALSSLSASAAPLSTTLVVNQASAFNPGDYFFINPGQATQENPKILSINNLTNTITHTGVNYAHYSGELIFMNALKLYAKGTLPIGQLNGVAQAFINLGITYDCYLVGR